MSKWPFTKGWHEIGNGLWAYLLPDGNWDWSNALLGQAFLARWPCTRGIAATSGVASCRLDTAVLGLGENG